MEKLELKHLAPYLPYGLKYILYHSNMEEYTMKIEITNIKSIIKAVNSNKYHDEYKPILRPLSDLTKSIQIAEFYTSFITHIRRITGFEVDIDLDIDGAFLQSSYIEFNDYHLLLEFLYGYHFDVFGLIEKGLAIDINTLEK